MSGAGVMREEVWEDERGKIARYNLAFINHFSMKEDNGRVLGYDNAHGFHHRHFKGTVEVFPYANFRELTLRFYDEVQMLKAEIL